MRDDDQGGLVYVVEVLHQVLDFRTRVRIEVPCRLVANKTSGFIIKARGKGHSLLFAAGQLNRACEYLCCPSPIRPESRGTGPERAPWLTCYKPGIIVFQGCKFGRSWKN